jgi:hypothetical protein
MNERLGIRFEGSDEVPVVALYLTCR